SKKDFTVAKDAGAAYDPHLTAIEVKAENPNSKIQKFTVNVPIVEPEEDAELNSVTIAGSTATPNSKNEVTVNVPKATEVTSLTVDFNISKNAYVVMGGPENIKADGVFQIEADDTFNFLAPRKFTVVS